MFTEEFRLTLSVLLALENYIYNKVNKNIKFKVYHARTVFPNFFDNMDHIENFLLILRTCLVEKHYVVNLNG